MKKKTLDVVCFYIFITLMSIYKTSDDGGLSIDLIDIYWKFINQYKYKRTIASTI